MTTIINGSGNAITFPDGTIQTTAATTSVPSGSVALFYQAAAPTGWTQVTTHNNKDIRVVSGTGGGSGGTTAYTSVFTNQTPSFTGSNGTLAVGAGTLAVGVGTLSAAATTLSTAQMPSHAHGMNQQAMSNSNAQSTAQGGTGATNYSFGLFTLTMNSQGSSSSHTHSVSGSPSLSGAPALSGTISGTNGPITLNVQYIDVILCSKN